MSLEVLKRRLTKGPMYPPAPSEVVQVPREIVQQVIGFDSGVNDNCALTVRGDEAAEEEPGCENYPSSSRRCSRLTCDRGSRGDPA